MIKAEFFSLFLQSTVYIEFHKVFDYFFIIHDKQTTSCFIYLIYLFSLYIKNVLKCTFAMYDMVYFYKFYLFEVKLLYRGYEKKDNRASWTAVTLR